MAVIFAMAIEVARSWIMFSSGVMLCCDQDALGEDVTCELQASVAYDVIEVRLRSSRDSSRSVTVQLTYSELQRCLPSQVTLHCGLFFCVSDNCHSESSLSQPPPSSSSSSSLLLLLFFYKLTILSVPD